MNTPARPLIQPIVSFASLPMIEAKQETTLFVRVPSFTAIQERLIELEKKKK